MKGGYAKRDRRDLFSLEVRSVGGVLWEASDEVVHAALHHGKPPSQESTEVGTETDEKGQRDLDVIALPEIVIHFLGLDLRRHDVSSEESGREVEGRGRQ